MSSQPPLKLIVLARDQKPHIQNAWRKLSRFLEQQSPVEIVAAEVTEDLRLDDLTADLVVVVGGDGAILRACRKLAWRQLPLLGINLGRLGFLADLSLDDFCEQFPLLQEHRYVEVEHLMFECLHLHSDGTAEQYLGLNEVAISSAASLTMLDVNLCIDGAEVTTYSGDGLIISTPVGSTAHSLSAGGPILRQNLQAFVVTPICPHTLTNRPLVDQADCTYSLEVENAPPGVTVVIDGQIHCPWQPGDRIEVRKAPVSCKLVRLPGHNYYTTLHHKLGWGGQPRYRDYSE